MSPLSPLPTLQSSEVQSSFVSGLEHGVPDGVLNSAPARPCLASRFALVGSDCKASFCLFSGYHPMFLMEVLQHHLSPARMVLRAGESVCPMALCVCALGKELRPQLSAEPWFRWREGTWGLEGLQDRVGWAVLGGWGAARLCWGCLRSCGGPSWCRPSSTRLAGSRWKEPVAVVGGLLL